MKTLKRLMCILLTVILLIPFAGCSRPGENNNPADNSGMNTDKDNNDNVETGTPSLFSSVLWWNALENPYNIKDKESIELEVYGGSTYKLLREGATSALVIIQDREDVIKNIYDESDVEKETIATLPYEEFCNKYEIEGDELYYTKIKYRETYEVPLRLFEEMPQAESYERCVYIYAYSKNENGDLQFINGCRIFYEINGNSLTLSTRY